MRRDAYQIIEKPLITEKGTDLKDKQNKYVFKVDRDANKVDIKHAIEEVFKVRVVKVNTMWVSGKKKRVRFKEGKTPDWKKAVVTLREGDKIDLF